ncbi:hypothetical protein M0R72_00875 [Candidatus Pacearchaeota archaeon]|jgi:hypothetical protein|nr:hypothetical protein [Candidatus Pacearchaeota archaeon]
MAQIVHEFTIRRKDEEIELKASFEVTPVTGERRRPRAGHRLNIDQTEGGHAVLDGKIFLVDSGLPWDGHLTKREQERVEDSAWEVYVESEPEDRNNRLADDCCFIDGAFDDGIDGFDDDQALKLAGCRGTIHW